MHDKVTKMGPKWGPKCIIFDPRAGSEGVSVLGVCLWWSGVPFGVRFGSLLVPCRGSFSGAFSGGVWGASWGPRHQGALGEGRIGGGSEEYRGRVGLRMVARHGSWGPLKNSKTLN